MECTPKLATKVTVTEKSELCLKCSMKKSNDSIKQMFKVLSLSRTRVLSLRRHWLTALSTTLCFSSVLTEIRRGH